MGESLRSETDTRYTDPLHRPLGPTVFSQANVSVALYGSCFFTEYLPAWAISILYCDDRSNRSQTVEGVFLSQIWHDVVSMGHISLEWLGEFRKGKCDGVAEVVLLDI